MHAEVETRICPTPNQDACMQETWIEIEQLPSHFSIALPRLKCCSAELLLRVVIKGGAHICCVHVSSIHKFTQYV